MTNRLINPWIKDLRGRNKYCQFCHWVEEHGKNCLWLYASQLQEYYEASQAVEEGIVDFDLHHDAVERLRKATEALGGE